MYNKKTLTFTFHHYWGAFCQGAFVLDPIYIYLYLCVFAQLPMQPLPIITDVSMNLDQGDVYNIM
jgi:hypothetical protein